MAVAAASLSTEMLSMSFGLRKLSGLRPEETPPPIWSGTPSMTKSGSFEALMDVLLPSEGPLAFERDGLERRIDELFEGAALAGVAEPLSLAALMPWLQAASEEDLQHLLTAIVRGERFSDGTIEGAFESGMLLAITRRAQVLADEAGA